MCLFDLRTKESIAEFISDVLNIECLYILEKCKNSIDESENLIELFNIDDKSLRDISLERIRFVIQHVTTSNNDCRSFREFGILDTQESLIKETPIKRFLEDEYGISFDIERRLLKFNNVVYDNDYKSLMNIKGKSGNEPPNYKISRKIYSECHYPVDAFFYISNPKSYLGRIHEQPELIRHLDEFIYSENIKMYKDKKPIEVWRNKFVSYLITAIVEFSQINFAAQFDIENLQRELIEIAFDVLTFHLKNDQKFPIEKLIALNKNMEVSNENIISIDKI